MASALRVQVSPSAFFNENLKPKHPKSNNNLDISVILISNGPGELTTWVKPIAKDLHTKMPLRPFIESASISLNLVLVPCPNATGNEAEAARKWNYFDTIINAKYFWSLLLNPKRHGSWAKKGVVVFLGGDQFWSVLLSARLGYKHITYAEWIARWPQWNDRIAVMSQQVKNQIPKRFHSKCAIVGDLMADLSSISKQETPLPNGQWVALLPGSKKAKLSVGVPFLLEVADRLKNLIPNCKFILPIAPTTSAEQIQYFSSNMNPIAHSYSSSIKKLSTNNTSSSSQKIITNYGTEIHLKEEDEKLNSLSQCSLALTTVGANTAELGALCIPMIVIVPMQHLSVMQAWDGTIGLIARIPIIRKLIGFLLSKWRLRKSRFLAWPNISAQKLIVPEKVGKIIPKDIAKEAAEWLSSPNRLKGQKEDLQNLRGKPGAVKALGNEIQRLIASNIKKSVD